MREIIIIGNWKMNKNEHEALEFLKAVDHLAKREATVGVAPTYLCLSATLKNAKNLVVAAQNCHYEDSGAYTGEVSAVALAQMGIKYCIIGHSERRQYFNETDETVNKKALKLLNLGITPIICVGENEDQFNAKLTADVVKRQIELDLANIAKEDLEKVVIAYEPIWAIGTGKTATKEIAQETCKIIRDKIAELYDVTAASKVRIQYGGSVTPVNIAEFLAMDDIDGALVGGASLKSDAYLGLIEAVK